MLLSTRLVAEVHRDGRIFRQTHSKGVPTSQVEVVGECTDRGTTVTFKPDGDIFTHTTEYKYEILANRLRELAFLNKGIHLSLTDKRQRDEQGEALCERFYSEEGLKEFVRYLDATRAAPPSSSRSSTSTRRRTACRWRWPCSTTTPTRRTRTPRQ